MRTIVVLALLLSVITPPAVSFQGESSSVKSATTAAMGAPSSALCQLVRDSAASQQTFSGGWLPALDRAADVPLVVDSDHPVAHASLLHAVAIDLPPLAPRPPPAA